MPKSSDTSSAKKEKKPKKPGSRQGGGPKPFRPTDENKIQVEAMAGYGVPLKQVASLIGIDEKTLYKYFRKEIDNGKAKANAKIGQTLFQQAMAGNTSAAIWWTKSQMGWRDKKTIELTGEDGQAIKTDNTLKVEFIEPLAFDDDEENDL